MATGGTCPYCEKTPTSDPIAAPLRVFNANYCSACKSITGKITAPVSGVIDTVDSSVGIYIPRSSNHKLFAPITGIVSDIEEKQGLRDRKTKTGSVNIAFHGLVDCSIDVEVGTHKVQLSIHDKDPLRNVVLDGQEVGEIIMGNYLTLTLPSFAKVKLLVNAGDRVIGGETVCAVWALTRPILLTVPHALCLESTSASRESQICDLASKKSALNLAQHLAHDFGQDVIVLPGNLNRRAQVDLNRAESRLSLFRGWVYNLIPFIRDAYDIHSFPQIPGVWGGKRPRKRLPESSLMVGDESKKVRSCEHQEPIVIGGSIDHSDIVILEDRCDLKKHNSYDLLQFLGKSGIGATAALLQGAYGLNDIQDELQKFGKETFLIEYGEELSDEKLNAYNSLIASWIASGELV